MRSAGGKSGSAQQSKGGFMSAPIKILTFGVAACVGGAFALAAAPAKAWEPTHPIEIIVPAGTGGGADQMARTMQGIITKHNLSKQSVVVINKSGGAGGEGFLDVKNSKGNAHKLIITLSNLFTTPFATGIPFNWKDITPVAMMALDEFVLWTNAEKPYKSVKDYVAAIKAAPDNTFKMGGTGSKQEDQIITVALEKATGKKMTYIPYKGGGEVAVQLVGNHIDSSVNNPIEAVAHWRAGKLNALCVFDAKKLDYPEKVTPDKAWADIPTCKSEGLDVEYVMLRGFFMPPGVSKDEVAYYVDMFKKVRETPEWKKLMSDGAFNTTFMVGDEYTKWVTDAEKLHQGLMKDAGFLAKTN
jgi:putative tricarboxylic transport membrane protein